MPQLSKYEHTHEFAHLRFINVRYSRCNNVINLVEDFVINNGLRDAIRRKAKKIRLNSKRCNIFSINDMEIIFGYITPTMRQTLEKLTLRVCRRILCKNTPIEEAIMIIVHSILTIEIAKLTQSYIDYYMQCIREALGQ